MPVTDRDNGMLEPFAAVWQGVGRGMNIWQ